MIYESFFNINNKRWKLYYQIDCVKYNDFQLLQLDPFILFSKLDSVLSCNVPMGIIMGQIWRNSELETRKLASVYQEKGTIPHVPWLA